MKKDLKEQNKEKTNYCIQVNCLKIYKNKKLYKNKNKKNLKNK